MLKKDARNLMKSPNNQKVVGTFYNMQEQFYVLHAFLYNGAIWLDFCVCDTSAVDQIPDR